MTLTPKAIVHELDRYIIGQDEAKKAVAIALASRERRKKVDLPLRDDIYPRNILMVGPTGVGKTEICRRLAQIVDAPFIKVDATKYTEIGYVGKDVESIIRDLVEIGIKRLRDRIINEAREKSREEAVNKVVTEMVGSAVSEETFEKFKRLVLDGGMDDREVEIEYDPNKQVNASPNSGGGSMPFGSFDFGGASGGIVGIVSPSDIFGGKGSGSSKKKTFKVPDAIKILTDEIVHDTIDTDAINRDALESVEKDGIVFIDEVDKIAISSNAKGGEVSREGVQRDLLPLLEGTMVSTKYGIVKTDYILFIASGAFYACKPSDLSPEFQGRLPVRVDLKSLTRGDMRRILTEPDSSLVRQYTAMLKTDDIDLNFEDSGVDAIVDATFYLNLEVDNVGARRLFSILEKILEEVSFDSEKYKNKKVLIDGKYVDSALKKLLDEKLNLSKFVL